MQTQPCSSLELDLALAGNHRKEKEELRMNVVSSPTRPPTYPGVMEPRRRKKTNFLSLPWIHLILGWQKARSGRVPSQRPEEDGSGQSPAKRRAVTGPRGEPSTISPSRDLGCGQGLTQHRVTRTTSNHRNPGDNAVSHALNHKYFTFTVEATHLIKGRLGN